MDKEKFMKLLQNAKVDNYGNLYILEKEIEKPIFEDMGEKRWYFSLTNTVCDDLIEGHCVQDNNNNFELYDRHFWNDDTLEVKIINNGNPKKREEI